MEKMKKKNASEEAEEDVGAKYRLDLLKILEIFRNTPSTEGEARELKSAENLHNL